jgi:hypothetical protein
VGERSGWARGKEKNQNNSPPAVDAPVFTRAGSGFPLSCPIRVREGDRGGELKSEEEKIAAKYKPEDLAKTSKTLAVGTLDKRFYKGYII